MQHSKLKPFRMIINTFKAQITSAAQVWVQHTALDKEHTLTVAAIAVF